MQPFTLRWLIPFTLVVLLLAACGDTVDDTAETTAAPTTTTEAVTSTTTTQAPTTTVPRLPSLPVEDYEGVDASDVVLIEALVNSYSSGDGSAFVEAMGVADEVLYFEYHGDGDYTIQVDRDTQVQSLEDWESPVATRWELRRCEPSESLPNAIQCAMYRYDPIADTEMHRFPVDVVLSVTTKDGAIHDVWVKYMEPNWKLLAWELSIWVDIFYPDDFDVIFSTEETRTAFHFWDLHHSEASTVVFAERVAEWEEMTLLSQDEAFYDWVAENEPEALDVIWPAGWGLEHRFTEDQASYWPRLVDEYTG